MRTRKGLTLVELLVAIVVFGIAMTVLLMPLTQSFRMTRATTDSLSLNTQAQNILESIRGQWRSYPLDLSQPLASAANIQAATDNGLSRNRFDLSCVQNLDLSNATVVVQNLDLQGAVVSSSSFTNSTTTCTGTPGAQVVMKRITVSLASPNTGETISLALDIPRP